MLYFPFKIFQYVRKGCHWITLVAVISRMLPSSPNRYFTKKNPISLHHEMRGLLIFILLTTAKIACVSSREKKMFVQRHGPVTSSATATILLAVECYPVSVPQRMPSYNPVFCSMRCDFRVHAFYERAFGGSIHLCLAAWMWCTFLANWPVYVTGFNATSGLDALMLHSCLAAYDSVTLGNLKFCPARTWLHFAVFWMHLWKEFRLVARWTWPTMP